MIIFTFIRHGQSTDNVKRLWAGWKDAPLSNHGMKQARALGGWFSEKGVHFSAILSSTLNRASTTAEAILEHQPDPQPPHIKSLLLREQHFGVAEGKPWAKRLLDSNLTLAEHYDRGLFPSPSRRSDRFPGGESRDDLAARANRVIDELLLPYVWSTDCVSDDQRPVHIAIVSHGMLIRELVDALYRREEGRERMLDNHRGLSNTGWTRVVVRLKDSPGSPIKSHLSVQITVSNEHEHLDRLVRQPGGIGNSAHDPKQKDIRGFFNAGAPSRS